MDLIGIIVQSNEGACSGLIKAFEIMPHINVHSIKNNQIVLILDTDDIHVLAQKTKEIQKINGVIGVYPVFSKDSLPV